MMALTNTTGTITFSGDLYATSLTAAGNAYNVALNGTTTDITNAVTFSNTGTVSLGNGSDTSTFANGLTHTAGATVVNGTVTATAGNVTLAGTRSTVGRSAPARLRLPTATR